MRIPHAVVESKRGTFLRLAEKRTNAVINKVRILGNCSNPYAYEYSEEDIRRIFSAIEREIRTAKGRFRNHTKTRFTLR